MLKKILIFLVIFGILIPFNTVFASNNEASPTLPEGFIVENIIEGIPSAAVVAFAPNGMVFIASKLGMVQTFQNGFLNPEPFIDISDEVNSYWDRGLLGIAVHPQFPDKPFVYLLYSYDPPGVEKDGQGSRVSRLIRVSADPNNLSKSLSNSKKVILGKNSTIDNIGDADNAASVDSPACFDKEKGGYIEDCIPSDSPSHSIGTVLFGLDGSLYVGTGEGSHFEFLDKRAGRAQNLNALSGKILRVNPENGEGLPDNPFYSGNPQDNQSRVWDYGLRNPFRFTQNPDSGEIIIGDVGWNLWEEINTGRGNNFGWPCFEGAADGNLPQPGFSNNPDFADLCGPLYKSAGNKVTPPIFSFETGDGGAVVVGPIYKGSSYPEEYHNVLFFADYDKRIIWYLHQESDGKYERHEFASEIIESGGPVQLLVGDSGDIFCMIFDKESEKSKLVRFVYDPAGKKHGYINISASPSEGNAPLEVEFRVTSTNLDFNSSSLINWNFGDGTKQTGKNVIHSYAQNGKFVARATMDSVTGVIESNEITINSGNTSSKPEIVTPDSSYLYKTGDLVTLKGKAVDPEDGDLPDANLTWNVIIHHKGHVHTDFFNAKGATAQFSVPDHGDKVWLEICLTAVDSGGLESKTCRQQFPKTTAVTFTSDPPGLAIVYEGESKITPFEENPVQNSQLELDLADEQSCMLFENWSDGGNRSHTLIVKDNPIDLQANFRGILPTGWALDIIGTDPDGIACLHNNIITIWPTSGGMLDGGDGLKYLYTSRSADFSIEVQIPLEKERLAPRNAGFLIRDSLDPKSHSLFMGWTNDRKLEIQNREEGKEKLQHATIKSLPLFSWQRISRAGERILWEQSVDGIKWSKIVQVEFPTSKPLLIGLIASDLQGENFGPIDLQNLIISSDTP